MRAIVCTEIGPVDRLSLTEVPDPQPGPGEVLIDVSMAALNFPDILIVAGNYQFPVAPPFSPGSEAAGTVAAIGEGVDWEIGAPVVGVSTHGAMAEKWIVPAWGTLPFPEGLSYEEAAGFTMTYGTSYYALKQRADLQPGETLLVLGAAGGVGSAAVELGKVMGARVIAVASTEDKREFLRSLDADYVIGYKDLRDTVREVTSGAGADVVYDPVGGAVTEAAMRSLSWEGRLLVIGFAAGDIPAIPLNLPLLKGASIIGVFWGSWMQRGGSGPMENVRELYRMAATGQIKPRVSAVHGFEDFHAAFAHLSSRTATGKVVLRVSD